MQVTYKDLVFSVKALSDLYAQRLPLKVTLRLVPLVKEVNKHLADYNEIREKIATAATEAQAENVGKDMQELLATEVEIAGDKLNAADLPETISISPADLTALSWLLSI